MPPPADILNDLNHIANAWTGFAVAWHVAIGGLLIWLVFGWRPTRRQLSLILVLPLGSVSVFAWLAHNPFNGALFAVVAVGLAAIGTRLPGTVQRASNPVVLLGAAMIAYGWSYPHFLEGEAILRYLYEAPTGLVPCPTLAVVIGFTLLFGGLQSRTWSLLLATLGLFYGLFGTFRLGVHLDAGLIVGALSLAAVGLRAPKAHLQARAA